MSFILDGVRLVDDRGERSASRIAVAHSKVAAVGAQAGIDGPVIDASGLIVTPGFIDVHTHGGGGFKLHTDDPEDIGGYARWAPAAGTTAFLTTIVGVPGELPLRQIGAAVEAIERQGSGARILGIHLEGPYINPARRGAHDPAWLRLSEPAETERLLETAAGHLRLVTLAPELPGADQMIRRLVDAGVTVSIGHTNASYEQARRAIALGVSHATHCFNAMPPLLHREPGPLAAIIEADQVLGELIADGVHVHPPAMRALIRALGPDRAVVVTDAQPPAGMGDIAGTFAGQPARVVDGAVRLADGTLAGSVLTMDQALRNLVEIVDVSLPEAVAMLSYNPARAAGVADRKGRVQPGYDADLLLFDDVLTLQAAFCGGKLAFVTDAYRDRLQISAAVDESTSYGAAVDILPGG